MSFFLRASCLPAPVLTADAVLALIDSAIAVASFVQLLRIHLRSQQLGWTRQKIFHLMIGSCNIGFLAFFVSTLVATCEGWQCWPHSCGFILMACPQILFLAAFLLLLSFWVDLCHQPNDDEEEDEEYGSYHEALLDKSKTKTGLRHADAHHSHRKCCSFQGARLGSRQKFVILVIVLTFVFMFAFAALIWFGRGENPIDSSLLTRVYLDIFSVAVLLLGGALACYGLILFSKMRKVRSETVSSEKWKVASLAGVSLICFTSSAILALATNVPVLSYRYSSELNIIFASVFMFLYFFIGSSVPCAFVLWVMRELPQRQSIERPVQHRVVAYIRESRGPGTSTGAETTTSENPLWRAAVTSSQSKALKSSPI
ncbi:hypothetical protein LUZ61_014233 [Rhynchospora tenuis]|uniref:THH1/TOM1/TOM3 domain-containing protein n=1 Tax=Rhynchospora tenuis TaxID=198213 RepID=A0AAD5WAX9_9POAL|nr:hypothetical protein LUZ61_014233 [Rhynchospora tenuis]